MWLGRLAQLEERRPYKAKVAGSRPAAPTIATTGNLRPVARVPQQRHPRLADRLMSTTPFVGATRLSGQPAQVLEGGTYCCDRQPSSGWRTGDEHNAFCPVARLADEHKAFCQDNRFVGTTGRRFLEAALLPRQATVVRLAGRLMSATPFVRATGRRLQNYCEDRRGRVFV